MAAFIIYIIRWAVVLTLLYSLYGLFLKRETLHGFNRVVLLVILVASMMLPLCQIEAPRANIVTQGREMLEQQILLEERIVKKEGDYWAKDAETEYVSNIDRITNGALAYDKTPLRTKRWNWVKTLMLLIEIYAVGLIVCWLRYFWQLAALLLLIRKGKRVDIEGLPKHVRAITHPSIKTPCSWMRWIILSPSDVNTKAIINHELAHIRYGHSWDMLLCEFSCRMLWCLPFVWMLRQDLRDVHEYQADRRVLATGIKDEEYQLLLIRKAIGTGLQPVVNALNQSPIKRRFKMMYTKPSRRWVALKAAYLLPLSAMVLMAFARPQVISEIEQNVEKTETEVKQAVVESGVIEKVTSIAEDLGLKEHEPGPKQELLLTTQESRPDSVVTTYKGYVTYENTKTLTDANLVKADLADSNSAEEAFVNISAKRADELLDSTMQAVGARKIAKGTWIGHFQPSLNNDTVRISKVEYLDKQSRLTGSISFPNNDADPYAYNMVLQKETRKERTGYYIRRLYPAKATERNFDKPNNDPKKLSIDAVLVKGINLRGFCPVAIERTKKETRLYLFLPCGSDYYEHMPHSEKTKQFEEGFANANYAIHDVATGDKYMFRSMDKSYFKLATVDKEDSIFVYQACLIFPPLDKKVKEIKLAPTNWNLMYGITTIKLKDIPTKACVITN